MSDGDQSLITPYKIIERDIEKRSLKIFLSSTFKKMLFKKSDVSALNEVVLTTICQKRVIFSNFGQIHAKNLSS
jgi:hypothetical protein